MRVLRTVLVCLVVALVAVPRTVGAADRESNDTRLQRAFEILNEYRGNDALLEAARSELETILKDDPAYAPAYREMARYFIMRGYGGQHGSGRDHLLAAEKALTRALAIDPAYADAYVLFGRLYYLMGRLEDAKDALNRATEIGTDSPWLDLNWADVLFAEGRTDEANSRYRSVLNSGTDNYKAIRSARRGLVRKPMEQAAHILDNHSGNRLLLQEAKTYLDAAISSEPSVARLHILLGRFWICWSQMGGPGYDEDSLQFAERSFKTAIALEPMFGNGYLKLAQVYILMNRLKEAKSALANAEKNGNTSVWITRFRADIAQRENLSSEIGH